MRETRYREYKLLAKRITKGDERYIDLLHDVLIQLQTNDKWNNLNTKEEQLYFLSKALTNQFYSNSSSFQRTYKRYSHMELQETLDISDTIYEEQPTIEWINEALEEQLKEDPHFWYEKGIFELWVKHNCFIERVHKQTKIPRYSIKETINQVKDLLINKWKKYKECQS